MSSPADTDSERLRSKSQKRSYDSESDAEPSVKKTERVCAVCREKSTVSVPALDELQREITVRTGHSVFLCKQHTKCNDCKRQLDSALVYTYHDDPPREICLCKRCIFWCTSCEVQMRTRERKQYPYYDDDDIIVCDLHCCMCYKLLDESKFTARDSGRSYCHQCLMDGNLYSDDDESSGCGDYALDDDSDD